MNWLPQFSIERPITVVMVFLSICVLGAIAWSRIPLELFPSGATGQSLYIRVAYPDSQPRATEEAVTLPIEDHLSDLEGLKTITSRSRATNASINVEFHRSIPMSAAYNAVVDRMERALLELPEEAPINDRQPGQEVGQGCFEVGKGSGDGLDRVATTWHGMPEQ